MAFAQTPLTFTEPVKQRVFVLTDITNELMISSLLCGFWCMLTNMTLKES